jgi:PA14 domain/Bacterial pre-peptidase C-terminal domain
VLDPNLGVQGDSRSSNVLTTLSPTDSRTDAIASSPSGSTFPEINANPTIRSSSFGVRGLSGDYFSDESLTNKVLTRTDATVDFSWGKGSPAASLGADDFSVRWSGKVQPLYSETYTFYTSSDDGVRLWVDGKLLIDHWKGHAATEDSGSITLSADQSYDIRLEYYEDQWDAVAKLLWSSASQTKQVIPQSQLFTPYSGALPSGTAGYSAPVGFDRDLGTLTSTNFTDSVTTNAKDTYRFALETPSTVNLTLNGLTADANLQLLNDRGDTISQSANGGTTAETIAATLDRGTYFVQAISSAPVEANYGLTAAARSATEQAKSADSFIDSMGIVTHLRYGDTSYGRYGDIVEPRLRELGIRHIRDGGSDPGMIDKLNRLATFGIKSTLVMDPRDGITPDNAVEMLKKVLPSVDTIEGPNEWDINSSLTYKGKPFPNGVRDYQTDLYKAVKGDPATAFISVLAPSMAIPEYGDQLGSLESVADGGNMHSYAGGNLPAQDLDWRWMPHTRKVSGGKAIVATETGWHNAVSDVHAGQKGVSEEVSAKYIPRLYLEYFNQGVKRTFLYELMDERPQPDMENNFGIVRADGTPKPAFHATKNLISLLQDTQGSKASGSLGYYLTGNTQNVHHTLLQKSNGDFYLVLWLNTVSTNTPTSQQVTLNLISPIQQAVTYSPNQSTNPIGQSTTPTQLTLNVPDSPLVVKLTPSA